MTKHITHSKLWTTAVALALLLGSALMLSGQDAKKQGLPKDWSMHHVVFSKPGAHVPAARLQKLLKDPRYILQQELRAAMAAPPSLPAALGALKNGPEPDISTASYSGPLPRGLNKALIPPTGKEALPTSPENKHRFHKDWSVGVGSNGTTGVGQFPATFTQTATPCATDIAIYNTGLSGSSSQATVVAYNNIYASCNGGPPNPGPTVYYAYNTGTAIVATSVDLSEDGTQIAFIQGNSGSAASLVVVRTANSGGSVTAPTTPTAVASTSYNGCTAPCQTTIAFSGGNSDTYSSPFYDYSSDTLYVGDDNGRLHQFTGVFGETYIGGVLTPTGANPTETTTNWPLTVSSATTGGALGSPVYDATTGLVFVGDYLLNYASTCEPSATNSLGSCGYLYSILASTTAVNKSAQLDYQYGIVDSPIVDPTTAQVYAFAGADNTTACSSGPCAGVFNLPEGAVGNGPTEAQVGAGYEFLLSGAFDNSYFTTGTGHLYVVGGTGPQNNTLYQIPMTAGVMSTSATTGPAVAANYTNGYYAGGLQVTEFYTGTNDYLFAGALMATTNPLVGLVAGYDVTAGVVSPSTSPTGVIAAQGGPSGIVVDNSLATAQNIYYSTTLNAACTTSGTGGCAVQTIQSAP